MADMNLPIPNVWIDAAGLLVLVFIILAFLYKIRGGALYRFDFLHPLSSIREARGISGETSEGVTEKQEQKGKGGGGALSGIVGVVFYDVFAARTLKTCSTTKRAAHLLIFWGFVCAAISTTLAYLTNPTNLILPLTNPVKIFGNAGGALIAAGFVVMFYIRYQETGSPWKLTRADYFLLVLFLTVVTGFITQQAVYSYSGPSVVSATFWVHMVFIVLLLATAPFSKFSHALYKPFWLLYERLDNKQGKETLLPTPANPASESSSEKNQH